MRTFKAKVIHLRVSRYHGEPDRYICSKVERPVEDGRWTWNKDKVTCKNCLKRSKRVMYMQRRKMKWVEEPGEAE